jgi:hypothetical protein
MSYIGQAEDEWEAKQKKAAKKAALPRGPYCAVCEKRFHDEGRLKQHLRDAHQYTHEMWLDYLQQHTPPKQYC